MQGLKPLMENVDTIFTQKKLEKLSGQLQEFQRAKKSFGKSQSQWMDINLILSKPTSIRNARQALAHIERSYSAIKEAEFKIKKLKLDKKLKQAKLADFNEIKGEDFIDRINKEKLQVEIEEIDYQIETAAYYFEGALKTVQTYIDAYESLCKSKNVEGFDELDFEKEEEEYHIKTALTQSIRSVRRWGTIDEGNQEYLEQCGLNPSAINLAIQGFLLNESNSAKEGKVDFSMQTVDGFIDTVYQTVRGSSSQNATRRGINRLSVDALYRRGKEDV